MSFRNSAPLFIAILLATGSLFADTPKLLRSLSGPSGTIVGSHLEIADPRTRFVFPQDKSLTVYFEWEVAPGSHTLSAIWKQPDGKVVSISPDVKMVSAGPSMNCYWIFTLEDGLPNGVWTVEIRMDGQPAGSHYFEIAGMSPPAPPASTPAPPAEPAPPSLDDIFKSITPSLVWVHKLDSTGRRFDSATGFVLRQNLIATAFQAIDSASSLEIEFNDGRKVPLSEIAACSRTADWAVLKVDTGTRIPLKRGDPAKVAIGQRLIVSISNPLLV